MTPRSERRSRLGTRFRIEITARCRFCGTRLAWPIRAHNLDRRGQSICDRVQCQAAKEDG